MSSEAENKDGNDFGSPRAWGPFLWALIALSFLGSIYYVGTNSLQGGADTVVLSRTVYEELLRALDHEGQNKDAARTPALRPVASAGVSASAGAACEHLQKQNAELRSELAVLKAHVETVGQRPAAAQVSVASAAEGDYCAIEKIRLGFDSRFVPKSQEIRARISQKVYPTFEEMYRLVVNKDYSPTNNIWNTFPNPYHMKSANFHFPFSNLYDGHVDKMFKLLGRPPKFSVEVGSFHGHSALLQAKKLDQYGYTETPLLCIDPWTGDLGMVLYRDDWDHKLTPGEIADGRSTSYFQFMLNMNSSINSGQIGPKHIIPLAVTSVVGARFLMAVGTTPDTIYLDSAHEIDETYTELTLFFHVLAKGGVIMGDDFTWESVSHDVKRFCKKNNLQLINEGVTWMIKKPE